MNKLALESSPYLKQHADNPVDWYAWGTEAFEKARSENKPIFLSIGYSTCHWCHVMAHESFEDADLAKILNEHFVSIKVDREERPDVDSVYMTVCQMITGQGGWPLSVFLTPEKEPFFCGTYFPKESRYGRVGFKDLLLRIHEIWTTQKSEITRSVDEILKALKHENGAGAPNVFTDFAQTQKQYLDIAKSAKDDLLQSFDPNYGGFSPPPKFPNPHKILFLLNSAKQFGQDTQTTTAIHRTLVSMFKGGFFDHLAGGFHRYSTDEKWILPHFEKMLYDQAFLVLAYARAFEQTRNSLYKSISEMTMNFVLENMRSAEGLFFSAFDADSEGEEGKFYIWTEEELKSALTPEEYSTFTLLFEVHTAGNFRDEATHELTGQNILYLKRETDVEDEKFSTAYFTKLKPIREKLLQLRKKRIPPGLDNKILMDWNGFMIAALLEAGRIFQNQTYLDAGLKALTAIRKNFSSGSLNHTNNIPGFLDDYAALIWAFLVADGILPAEKFIMLAELLESKTKMFWDEKHFGYFMTTEEHESVLVRKKETYDGAYPSGNSIMAHNLIQLFRKTSKSEYFYRAEETFKGLENSFQKIPTAYSHWMSALLDFDQILLCTDESCPLPPTPKIRY